MFSNYDLLRNFKGGEGEGGLHRKINEKKIKCRGIDIWFHKGHKTANFQKMEVCSRDLEF